MQWHSASLSIEDQLAELRALCVALYDMICDQQTEASAELARLRDANAHMQRDIEQLWTALAAHHPTTTAHRPVDGAHRPVPGSQPPEPERKTNNTDSG